MKNYVKKAFELGYRDALVKVAQLSKHTERDDLNRMLIGAVLGGTSGAMIAGPYRRGKGVAGGALTGAIAANPQLFLQLLNQASSKLYNFSEGKKSKKGRWF